MINMILCCIIWLTIILIFACSNCFKKNSFFPERTNVCDERLIGRQVDPIKKQCAKNYDYNLGNSLNVSIDSSGNECKIRDPDLVVNPLTYIHSFTPLHLMFENQTFALAPGQRGYLIKDSDSDVTYDPSCVNVGMKKTSCKVDDRIMYTGDPIPKICLGDCSNKRIKEGFTSERRNNFEKVFYGGQGVLENDPRFPKVTPGDLSNSAEFSTVRSAGNNWEPGFLYSPLSPDGKLFTEYVELDHRLKQYDESH
jgi:hypothetical protein